MDLQFTGKSTTGHCLSTSNRTFTMTEEADICCYKANDVIVDCHEDWAVLSRTGKMDDPCLVQVFAVADNVYIAHQANAANIYVSEHLKDVLDAASDMIYTM